MFCYVRKLRIQGIQGCQGTQASQEVVKFQKRFSHIYIVNAPHFPTTTSATHKPNHTKFLTSFAFEVGTKPTYTSPLLCLPLPMHLLPSSLLPSSLLPSILLLLLIPLVSSPWFLNPLATAPPPIVALSL